MSLTCPLGTVDGLQLGRWDSGRGIVGTAGAAHFSGAVAGLAADEIHAPESRSPPPHAATQGAFDYLSLVSGPVVLAACCATAVQSSVLH